MAVRLFIGNLPYGATEADLRAHFASVAEPSHVVMPVDRETGRPRGFAFVEFAERAVAEEVIKRFDAQPFQGRNLAVSEARAREDRPPGAPRPGGFSDRVPAASRPAPRWRRLRWRWWRRLRRPAPERRWLWRPAAGRLWRWWRRVRRPASRRRPGGRDRSANFGPPAPPKRLRGAKKGSQQEHKPRGPIKERSGGRIYAVDDLEDSDADLDNIAKLPADDEDAETSSRR